MEKSLEVLDRLTDFLGNSDGQTTEEIEAELIEDMGEENYQAAKKRFMDHLDKLKRDSP